MATYVIGDIHSGLKALQQVLDRVGLTTKDHLIFLGDYVDSWSEAFETVEYLIALEKKYHCTFLRGNHDELCRNWMLTGEDNPQWLAHGGKATKTSYQSIAKTNWEKHLDFFASLKNYHLDAENRLFLHAGFTNLKGIAHEYFEKSFYWDRTLWELANALDPNLEEGMAGFPQRLTHYNEIFIGHTPLSKTGVAEPKRSANVWNLDTGAAFKGPLTLMDIDTKEFWQSDPVHLLYPAENGRN